MKVAKATLQSAQALLAAAAAGKLTEHSNADLLAFHTAHVERFCADTDKPVKRFADRASAERRALLVAQAIVDAANAPPPVPKTPAERGVAVAASWADAAVRAARTARHKVRVAGTEYGSVAKAFAALGLPLAGHGKVRGQLVAAGRAEHAGHKFVRVDA